MTSQVLNFLWLNLGLPAPPDPADGSIREPLPAKYIENVRKAGGRHPEAKIVLWVDSERLTERQMNYLKCAVQEGMKNVHLSDLRDIPAYKEERLYNQTASDPHWRAGGQEALIWRQVDAAKILVSLQGDFDQSFLADLDRAHLDIASSEAQDMLEKHGLLVGSASKESVAAENQLWGFTPRRRVFFEQYYVTALYSAYDGVNAWNDLMNKLRKEIAGKEGIPLKEFCFLIDGDGSSAEHPGHEWREGDGKKNTPSLISAGELAGTFDSSSGKSRDATPAVSRHKIIQTQPGMKV